MGFLVGNVLTLWLCCLSRHWSPGLYLRWLKDNQDTVLLLQLFQIERSFFRTIVFVHDLFRHVPNSLLLDCRFTRGDYAMMVEHIIDYEAHARVTFQILVFDRFFGH